MSTPGRRASKRLAGLASGVEYATICGEDPIISPSAMNAYEATVVTCSNAKPSASPQAQTAATEIQNAARGGGTFRLLLLAAVATLVAVLWGKFGRYYLTFDYLASNQAMIQQWVGASPWVSTGLYVGVMGAVIGLTCPGATFLSFLGGFLFPQPLAALAAYLGYNLGANLSFVTARYVLRDLAVKALESNALFSRFEKTVKKNAFMYIAVARFTLVFPFWFINMASAVAGVRWSSYAKATAVSTISGSVVYTCAGRALGNVLLKVHEGHQINTNDLVYEAIQDPNVIGCLIALLVCGGIALSVGSKYKLYSA